ncbi:hypothetical protein IFM89_007399 [Coptis chinensis]|uniref:Uncharacterized protein n=1 Tax=Coptis chinensis TaxID=261450 RepID=A0A835IN36_9MAGN|nr:hypothetical protein IFM89_007399 [Coptis chinensis]
MDSGENSDSDLDIGVDKTSDTPTEVNNTQDSSVERTGRGPIQCKRITKMREAESRISIVDYENWHAVGDEVRDLLWDTIKAKFNLTEDEKKGVVSDIGEKWKEFNSRLTRINSNSSTMTSAKSWIDYNFLGQGLELLIVRRTIKPSRSRIDDVSLRDKRYPIPSSLFSNGIHSFRPDGPKRKRVFVKVVEALVDVEGMVLLK